MATTIYKSGTITLIDGTEIYATPLKIKYLRQFMDLFDTIKDAETEDARMSILLDCCRVAMKQYYPSIKTIDDVEDNIDVKTMYAILKFSAGIDLEAPKEEESKDNKDEGPTWEKTDLAALESEVFLLGIWKDYEELETSMSMPELTATLNSKREAEYSEKKFLAAIQGVDLDEQSGRKEEDPWEAMKARVFSRGQASNSNDVLALQGQNAAKNGFGIGMGLDYERID
jgi:hypothetical protein